MSSPREVFHLAIPARDLAVAEHFYCALLGCHVARRYLDRITFMFFGGQLVCHHAPEEPVRKLSLYPRHFGITFRERYDFEALLRVVVLREVPVFQPVMQRFAGTVEEHASIVLRDPTDNLLEFKCYIDPRMMY